MDALTKIWYSSMHHHLLLRCLCTLLSPLWSTFASNFPVRSLDLPCFWELLGLSDWSGLRPGWHCPYFPYRYFEQKFKSTEVKLVSPFSLDFARICKGSHYIQCQGPGSMPKLTGSRPESIAYSLRRKEVQDMRNYLRSVDGMMTVLDHLRCRHHRDQGQGCHL